MRGSSSKEGEESDGSSPMSIVELFEQECPFYMAMGMSYHEYWYEDATLTRVYKKAYELKQQEWNTNAWVQGAYVYQAVLAIAPALNAMGKSKPQPYIEKPFEIYQTNGSETDEEAEERKRYENAKAKMEAFKSRVNKEMTGGEESDVSH